MPPGSPPRGERMPVPVVVAIAVVSLLGVLGVAAFASAALEIARDGVHGGGDFAGLPIPARAATVLVNAGFSVVAARLVHGLVRGSERVRTRTFSVATAISILFGAVGTAYGVVAAVHRSRGDAILAAALLLFALLLAATAWSLSRPAAKAWFGPSPPR